MFRNAAELCPEDLWFSTEYRNRFWHIAYHFVFYTQLYVQPSEGDFQAWSKHVPNSNCLGPRPRRTSLSKFQSHTPSRTYRNIRSCAWPR